MDMDKRVLMRGRYRNNTFEEIFKRHPDFCRSIREAAEQSKFYPAGEDFAKYVILKSKEANAQNLSNKIICEQGAVHFLKELTDDMRKEFENLVSNVQIDNGGTSVHPQCALGTTNGFLGVFYRFFIKKCVFNIRDEDGHNTYIENYATIFPFKVKDVKTDLHMTPFPLLARHAEFKSQTQNFLNAHFDGVKFDNIIRPFLSNIYHYKRDSKMDIKQLECYVKNENVRCIDGSGDRFGNFRQGKPCPHLKNFPRLNKEGAERYQKIYACYEVVQRQSGIVSATSCSYPINYFLNLPETNFYELFTLLDSQFFKDDFDKYTQRFHKYLFFFTGALRSTHKPIFFIDNYLFECLKSLHKFKKSRLPPIQLIHDLKMITLIHRRKQYCDVGKIVSQVDMQHLEHVRNYIENFRGIETAKIEYEIPDPDLLQCNALLCLDDTSVDVRFSRLRHGAKTEFWESFIMAALCEYPVIKRLVVYNAFSGTEYTVNLDESFDREGIKAFVRKYNSWDFSVEMPPEKSFTWGWEDCFVEGTINWEEKRKFH